MKKLFLITLLACLPLLAQGTPGEKVYITAYDNVLPQVADGLGWMTRITLVNMGTTTATFDLYFYLDSGAPWAIQLSGSSTPSSVWSGTIPAGGSIFLETAGGGSSTTTGWAYLLTQDWISGVASFKADWVDPVTSKAVFAEGVVPFAPENDVDFFIPFDNRNGYVTSIALVNPYLSQSVTLSVQFRNPDGTIIKTDSIPLTPLQHMAFETTSKYPETVGKNGVIEFLKTAGTAGASGMGLLFSPRSTFTSINSVSIDCHYWNVPCTN